jgi:cytochrome oxidase assembly protein ShyY1
VLRFLLTRRWLGLLLVVVIVGVACVELGLWQFRRFHERHDRNEVTRANLAADAAPVDSVLSTGHGLSDDDEWTVVQIVGQYDDSQTVTVRYRTRGGAPGVDVVVPLVTRTGAAVLVDRGWIQTAANGSDSPDPPPPPAGTVTVTGWARVDATGDETKPDNGSVRAISSQSLSESMPYPLYDGFVDLIHENPDIEPSPALADPPDLGSGPHFFYGVQWFFFALLAFGFWIYFAWSEYRATAAHAAASAEKPKAMD